MKNSEIAELLRTVSVETGSLTCLGCGYERSCGVHGCAIMHLAADALGNSERHVEALQKEIAGLRMQLPRWIPVEERLPEYDARVLAFDMRAKNKYIGIWTREKDPDDGNDCWFDSAGWWYAFDEISHWMPLPEPPEVENA